MLNLTKRTQKTTPITLRNGDLFHVTMPTKAVLDSFVAISDMDADTNNIDDIEHLYDVVAGCLSCNVQGKIIDAEYAGENINLEELMLIMQEYGDFIGKNTASPN